MSGSRGMASIGELLQRPGQARPEAAPQLKSRAGNAGMPKKQKGTPLKVVKEARVHKEEKKS